MRLKTLGTGIAIAAVLGGVSPGAASAAPADIRIVAGPGGATAGYVTAVAVHKTGKNLVFMNLDIVTHDVVSVARGGDGHPLFKSSLVGLRGTAKVVGAERLAVGTYGFFCSLHTNMKARLRVIN